MILQKLVEYYDRIAADPNSDIERTGFSRQKISFEIVLNPDGSLAQFNDLRVDEGKRKTPRPLVVLGQAKPSGSGLNPGFLWDNAQYVLGYKQDDPKPERTRQAFEAFRDRHLALEEEIGDEAFSAVCAFLRRWSPEQAADHPELAEIAWSFGVFRVAGRQEFVHDRPSVRAYWMAQLSAQEADQKAFSLLGGGEQPIARLHEPKIKGVRGAQTSGATLVAFNADAYESYGKKQSFNAPVGVEDAFKYCTALKRLTSDRERQVHLGDATVVYWAEQATPFEDELIGVFEPTTGEDDSTVVRVQSFLNRLRRAASGAPFEDGDVPFYILGLSPNAARISVRFWLVGTVQQFAERLGQHLADMELIGVPPNMPPICLQRVLDQTARERDDIQPLLSGALTQAVLCGGPYPQALLATVLRRVRVDGRTGGFDGHIRAAVVKAYLVRKARIIKKKEILKMELDKDCPNPAYQLGRLFAVLEKVQEEALGDRINATIKDRFFASASANPVAVFPRLLRLHAHHLDKLSAEKRGLKVAREKLAQEIFGRLDSRGGFPAYLALDDQGYFFIGYYHQRQDLFGKKRVEGEAEDTNGAKGAEEQ